jgi:hypothetical protein
MEAIAVNQVLLKLLLLALNLMPPDQAAFNFHVLSDGAYAATYRVQRRDQDFTVFRPLEENESFPAFDAERSRRFGRAYIARVQGTGEMAQVVLTEIMLNMPPLASEPRQILKTSDGDIKVDGVGRTLFLSMDGQTLTVAAEVNASL